MKSFPLPALSRLPGFQAWLRRFAAGGIFVSLLFSLFAAGGLLPAQAGTNRKPALLGTERIIINEVAWGGTKANSDHEWIELYNPTNLDIEITGWTLVSGDNNPLITLSGTISSRGYFLLERYQNSVGNITADLVYGSSQTLTNSGEVLYLYDNSSIPVLIDTANGDGGSWPAGSGSPDYCSMERIGPLLDSNPNWAKSIVKPIGIDEVGNNICGSPRAQNSQFITPTPSLIPSPTPEWERLILINEIAWGGTRADDTLAQWIELRNPGSEDVDITGWYLRIPDKGDIPLTGSIPARGFFLIERNETDTDVVSDLVYAFPIMDASGDQLFLYSDTHYLVDSANNNGGPWPAGNRFGNYASMERRANEPDTDDAWLTFNATLFAEDRLFHDIYGSPLQPNLGGAVSTPTFTPTNTPTLTPTYTLTPTTTPTITLTPTQTVTPSSVRNVIINEVAWMGTIPSYSHEWIELYNPGSVDINLGGWTILSNNSVIITIPYGKIIRAGKYFLILQNDSVLKLEDSSLLPPESIYINSFSPLSNDGARLSLRAPGQSTDIDTANQYGALIWPAGNNTTKCSMERTGINIESDLTWFTNSGETKVAKDINGNWICGSPGQRNWAYGVTATPTQGPNPIATRRPTSLPPARISQVIINEFLPFPRSDWNKDGTIDSGDEFIELMNVGNVSVSLQGWRLDDQDGDSSPYTIGGISLAPGARVVFFASDTGILLSNRSDSVRIFQPNGVISDAYTYTTLPAPEQTWCRLPDGSMNWQFGCQPTPGLLNELAKTIFRGDRDLPAICQSPSLPAGIYATECQPSGLEAWSRRLWDGLLPAYQLFFEQNGQSYWLE